MTTSENILGNFHFSIFYTYTKLLFKHSKYYEEFDMFNDLCNRNHFNKIVYLYSMKWHSIRRKNIFFRIYTNKKTYIKFLLLPFNCILFHVFRKLQYLFSQEIAPEYKTSNILAMSKLNFIYKRYKFVQSSFKFQNQ